MIITDGRYITSLIKHYLNVFVFVTVIWTLCAVFLPDKNYVQLYSCVHSYNSFIFLMELKKKIIIIVLSVFKKSNFIKMLFIFNVLDTLQKDVVH